MPVLLLVAVLECRFLVVVPGRPPRAFASGAGVADAP
jgi:hypothetical protein